jgi:hypothetical protein
MAMKHRFRIDWITILIILLLIAVGVIGTIVIFAPQVNHSFLGPGNML